MVYDNNNEGILVFYALVKSSLRHITFTFRVELTIINSPHLPKKVIELTNIVSDVYLLVIIKKIDNSYTGRSIHIKCKGAETGRF
jgi:hypothetical protein